MENNKSQKSYRIYICSLRQWVEVSKEFYEDYTRDNDTLRHREQSHGRCVCPRNRWWICNGDCLTCEYHRCGDRVSLDAPFPDGNGTLADYIPDEQPNFEDVLTDRELLKVLITRFRQLDPDADRIIVMRLENPKISNRKIAETLGRPQRTFADQMKRYCTELHKLEGK